MTVLTRARQGRIRFAAVALAAVGLAVSAAGCGLEPSQAAPGASASAPSSPAASGSSIASAPSTTAAPGHRGPADCVYTQTGTAARPVSQPPSTGVPMSGTAKAVITLTAGTIRLTLDRTDAPCTVNSFLSLARQKFYDNTDCTRMTIVASLSMLQCGDPTGTQTGGPGYTFPDELSGNETYPAGTLAMANSGPNTNGSQFFMVFKDSNLPPNYTVFGHLDPAGVAVLAKIAKGGVDNSNGPGDGKPKSEAKIVTVSAG